MRIPTTVLFCIFGLTTFAAARDIFVNNVAGDDRSDGLAEVRLDPRHGPVRTIGRGLAIAQKSDRIIVAGTEEPYREMLSLSTGRHSGTSEKPFTIVGNGAMLDGTVAPPAREWVHAADHVFSLKPRIKSYQQLYLDGKPAARRFVDPAIGELPQLEPLEWMLAQRRLYFRTEDGRLPEAYPVRYAGLQTGITLYHVRHVRIVDLVVQGFALDGVNAHDGTNDVVLERLTCRGNGRSGISIGGSSRIVVRDCLIGDNGAAQVRTEGYCLAELAETVIVDNTAPAHDIQGGRLYLDGGRIEP